MRPQKPNIIIIYADDLGFGDIGCYGGKGIATPNLDALAADGLTFTNGHATAATCTPSRYSLLTGAYPWRHPQARILPGDAPQIIPSGSPTLPALLRDAGYTTGVVGKWHLGIGEGNTDWNQAIRGTPLDVGFDHSFIMAATNDRVPCVYIDGHTVEGLDSNDPIEVRYGGDNPFPDVPTGRDRPDLLRMKHSCGHDMTIVNGVGRIGYMRGGEAALWDDETMGERFAERAVAFVAEQKDSPFFLYYALHQPHVPRLPGPRFAGSTGLGPRGDSIAELDWCVGEIIRALDDHGLRKNTLVVFSSDNGPVLDDGYDDQAAELCGDHRPAGPLRGGKCSMFDGGTRVPLILRWPAEVTPGQSDALVSQQDFLASFAELTGVDVPADAGLDSLNVLTALLGRGKSARSELVVEGTQTRLAFRQRNWVLIPPHEGPAVYAYTAVESGNASSPQLYDLSQDIGQIRNLATEDPDRARNMQDRLETLLASGRTRPCSNSHGEPRAIRPELGNDALALMASSPTKPVSAPVVSHR